MKQILLMLLPIMIDVPDPAPKQKARPAKQEVVAKKEEAPAKEQKPKPVDISHIAKVVGQYYHLTLDDLRSPLKTKHVAMTRQIIMYLCKKLTRRSLVEIGWYLGRKDHSTVLHGVNKITSMIEALPDFAAEMEDLKAEILG